MASRGDWYKSVVTGRDGFWRGNILGGPSVREVYGYYEDFAPSRLTSTTTYPGYTVTVVGAGTLVMADEVGGVLQLTPGALEDQGIEVQALGESFLPAADKDIFFEAKIRSNDVTENDIFVGISTTDTSFHAGNPADLIGFHTHDADANLDFEVSATAGAGAPVDTLTDLVDGAWMRVGFWVKGLTSVVPYINGVANATATVTTVANIPAVEMALIFAVQTGEAVVNTLDIDWFRIGQIR